MNFRLFSSMVALVTIVLLMASSAAADVCTNCAGTGKMISGWQVRSCSNCGGDGVVESGIPTLPLPDAGYQTNKFDLKAQVENGGWVVAWANDISETDAIQGVVSIGVSVVAENPGPFIEWVNALIDRTIDSMAESARERFPNAILGQVRSLAADAISAAVRGQDAQEVLRNYETADFKAGAIKYSGRNYVGNTTISRTWGLKPYIAFRWRDSGGSGGSTNPPQPTARYFYFTSPYFWANVNTIVVDEGYYTEIGNGKWKKEGWTKAARDGRIVQRSQSDEFVELKRGADGIVIRGPNTCPIKLSHAGVYVFRDYPVTPAPPGIDPRRVDWWFSTNGKFLAGARRDKLWNGIHDNCGRHRTLTQREGAGSVENLTIRPSTALRKSLAPTSTSNLTVSLGTTTMFGSTGTTSDTGRREMTSIQMS